MPKWKFTKLEIFFCLALLTILAIFLVLNFSANISKARKMKALANARSLGICLSEFDSQYGELPSDITIDLILDEGIGLPEGDTANHYLAQLLASKVLDSEKVFHVPGLKGTREGDDTIDTPGRILARGENGFGYVIPDETGLSASYAYSKKPVLVIPLLQGGSAPKFDPKLFRGFGYTLLLDGSIDHYDINDQGDLLDPKTRKSIFLNGPDTIWGTSTTVVIKAPWFIE